MKKCLIKKLSLAGLTAAMTIGTALPVMAGQWLQDGVGRDNIHKILE